jgi:HAD superfamily phosphoserine phosphatase-like hydrolase
MVRLRSISAFDLDHTLLNANSSFRFGLYLCQNKHLPLSSWFFIILCHLRHSLGLLSVTKLHETAFRRLFQGRSEPLIQKWVNEFLDKYLALLLYDPAVQRLKEAQKQGHLTVILSSSPGFLVEPIAKRLGVPLWKATKYAVDKDRCFCHIAHLMLGANKAKVIAQLRKRNKGKVTAYSDSHLDLPLLLAADYAIGVNPNRRLLAICQRNQWPVI